MRFETQKKEEGENINETNGGSREYSDRENGIHAKRGRRDRQHNPQMAYMQKEEGEIDSTTQMAYMQKE